LTDDTCVFLVAPVSNLPSQPAISAGCLFSPSERGDQTEREKANGYDNDPRRIATRLRKFSAVRTNHVCHWSIPVETCAQADPILNPSSAQLLAAVFVRTATHFRSFRRLLVFFPLEGRADPLERNIYTR